MEELLQLLEPTNNSYQGLKDVYEKNEKENKTKLRFLVKSLSLSNTPFSSTKLKILERKGGLNSIIIESLINYTSLFINELHNQNNILWINLLRNNSGIRKISPSLKKDILFLFSLFDIRVDRHLHNKSSQQLYNLGFYDEAYLKKDHSNTLLSLKLDFLVNDSFELADLEKLLSLDERINILSFMLVRNKAKSDTIYNKLFYLLEKYSDKLMPLTKVLCYNALNFYSFKKNNKRNLKNFSTIEREIKNIANFELRNHVRGNLYFHLFQVQQLAEQNKVDLQLEKLNLANKYDPGFFDYIYSKASIFHDQNILECLSLYTEALAKSPLSFNILNDLMCGLNDFNEIEIVEQSELVLQELNFEDRYEKYYK
jgi:hypothetical protein